MTPEWDQHEKLSKQKGSDWEFRKKEGAILRKKKATGAG